MMIMHGADRNRPAFCQLIKDAKNKKFNIVLCKSQSRFTRELELVEKYIHGLFPIWGIRFVGLVDNADTAIKGNKKSRQINGLVNEWYLEDLSDNIKSVLRDKKGKGIYTASFALYGYQKDPNIKGHLIIDEEASKIVKEIFTLFSQGYGKIAIAKILNDRNIPNPTQYKRQNGLAYYQPNCSKKGFWQYSTISSILINEMYIGNMVQHKYESISYKSKSKKRIPKDEWITVEGTHEPIIDYELWNTVQELIRQKAKPSKNGQIGIFARKLKCQCCQYNLRTLKKNGKTYYRCLTNTLATNTCTGAYISYEKLERAVLQELHHLINDLTTKKELLEKATFNNRIK